MHALDPGGKAKACRPDTTAEVAGKLARPCGHGGSKHHGIKPCAKTLPGLKDLKASAKERVVCQVGCVQWTLIKG
jgi:hypothetical protein